MTFLLFLLMVTLAGRSPEPPQAASTNPVRWPAGQAILVWIDAAGAPPGADALVERAMITWTTASNGGFRLEKTMVREKAAMRVIFIRGGGLYGESRPRVDDRTGSIVRADVMIAAPAEGDPVDQRIIVYLTALHEIGHALGLAHNDDFGSIMYSFRRPDDGERYFGAYRNRLRSPNDIGTQAAPGLSQRDIETLRQLYRSE